MMAVKLDPKTTNHETGLAIRVLTRIEFASKKYPIKYQQLAEEFGVSWRKIADIVEQLRDAGRKVATSNDDNPGAFIAKTPEEMLPTAMRLEIQGKRIIARARKLMDFGDQERTIFDSAAERKFDEEGRDV